MPLLDFLFPKKCVLCGHFGDYICKICFLEIEFLEKAVCPVCQRQAVGGKTHPRCQKRDGLDGLVVPCRYRGAVKKAIVKVKYRWVRDIENALGDLAAENLWKFEFPKDSILVPVPLSKKRKRWRGFNQAELLAKYFEKRFGSSAFAYLVRVRDTRPQVGLTKRERKKNIKDAFALAGGASVLGKELILVDDVYTSGATMAEAAKVLKRAGAKSVWGMAIALG